MSAIGFGVRVPATTSSPCALTRYSPNSLRDPSPGSRVNTTPVALSRPMLPNTMATTLTAVPSATSGVIPSFSRYTTARSPIQLPNTARTAISSCASGLEGNGLPACRLHMALNLATTPRRVPASRSPSLSAPARSFAAPRTASNFSSSTPNTTLPNSWTNRLYESHANRSSPLALARPSTVRSLRPRLSMVSIMPGIETAAPDLTETRRGSAAEFHPRPVSLSRRDTARRTSRSAPGGTRRPPA